MTSFRKEVQCTLVSRRIGNPPATVGRERARAVRYLSTTQRTAPYAVAVPFASAVPRIAQRA
eukprot:1101398-Rhodomonas_salina.1